MEISSAIMWLWTGITLLCLGMDLIDVHRVAKEVTEVAKRLERVR